jgi:hypothetical protein
LETLDTGGEAAETLPAGTATFLPAAAVDRGRLVLPQEGARLLSVRESRAVSFAALARAHVIIRSSNVLPMVFVTRQSMGPARAVMGSLRPWLDAPVCGTARWLPILARTVGNFR